LDTRYCGMLVFLALDLVFIANNQIKLCTMKMDPARRFEGRF